MGLWYEALHGTKGMKRFTPLADYMKAAMDCGWSESQQNPRKQRYWRVNFRFLRGGEHLQPNQKEKTARERFWRFGVGR